MGKSGDIGVLVWLVLSLALSCCGRNGTSDPFGRDETHCAPTLSEIDSLMWQRPDTALTFLVGYLTNDTVPAATPEGRFADHYAQLLASELLYKNDCEQTNRTELLSAVDYFDSLRACSDDLAFLAARAHYIKGVGSYERDSVVDACREYLQALEIMEDRFGEKDLVGHKARFMALTYTKLCVLFSNNYLHKQAIFFGECSLPFYQKSDPISWHIAWILDEIGSHYDMMDQLDSAKTYYHKALESLSDTTCLLYRDILNHQTFLSYKVEGKATDVLIPLMSLLANSKSEEERLARCFTIGEIYYHEKQYDSAVVYFDRVYAHTNKTEPKVETAKWLMEISKQKEDSISERYYAQFLSVFANVGEQKGEESSIILALFEDYLNKKEKSQQKTLFKVYNKHMVVIVLLSFAIILLSSIVHKKHIISLKEQNSTFILKMRDSAVPAPKPSLRPAEDYQKMLSETVCINIRQRFSNIEILTTNKSVFYSDLAINEKTKRLLVQTVESYCDGFGKSLKETFPKMNYNDVDFCRYLLIGLNYKQIAVLFQVDFSTTCRRMTRIKDIMGSNEPQTDIVKLFFFIS